MATEFTVALIGAAAVLVAAVLAWWLQRRRPREPSDREALRLWRDAFNRGAFRAPFNWRSDKEGWKRFGNAIHITIKALTTGQLEDSSGKAIEREKAYSRLENQQWASALDDVTQRLRRVEALAINVESDASRVAAAQTIDRERDNVIETLNRILREAGLPELPLPSSYSSFEEAFPDGVVE